MKLKEKLARDFSGTNAFVPEARMTPNELNRELTRIEDAYLAGFEKARDLATEIAELHAHVILCDPGQCGVWVPCETVHYVKKIGEEEV